MKKNLVFVDTSGSMNEMGKILLQRNLCRYIKQLHIVDREKYSDVEILLFNWAENILEIITQKDGDIPAFIAKGSANLNLLSSLLFKEDQKDILGVLILSDGHFVKDEIIDFKKKLKVFPTILICTVAVGADADLVKLKNLSSNDTVYNSENIAAAVDSVIFGSTKAIETPKSIDQILIEQATKAEENWDD